MFHQEIPLKDAFATLQAELQGEKTLNYNNLNPHYSRPLSESSN